LKANRDINILSNRNYNIIYADPPWPYNNWSTSELNKLGEKWARKNGRSPYKSMTIDEIYNLPVEQLADKDCVLFLWATFPKLREAWNTITARGFEYKTIAFNWVKKNKKTDGYHFGLGYWTRGNSEVCLLGTRGHLKRVSNRVSQLVFSNIREHSQKPDEVREKIVELMGDLPRIELFARARFEGWDVWGDEVDNSSLQSRLRI
jgi:N6-adenosine-specific RNA methylase IME4